MADLSNYQAAARIDNGALRLEDKDAFGRAMWRMRPGPVVVKIERPSSSRSAQANRYYWGVVLALIAEHTGYEQDELHEYFKKRFNPATVALGEAEETIGGSTAKLDTTAFHDYVERIRRFAETELDVRIPDPNEVAA